MAISRGVKTSGGTDFESGFAILADEVNTDLNTIVSGVNNVTITDSNVTAGANIDTSKVGDYSANAAEMQSAANPLASTTWTETTESLPTNLEEELARIRYVLKELTGGTYWFTRANQGVLVHTTGDLKWTIKTSADTGWIMWVDGTIGNAASGATVRANADTVSLYTLLYTNFDDTLCPVSTGRGASAAADYAANKTLRLPEATGRLFGLAGTPAATNTQTIIASGVTGANGNVGGTTVVIEGANESKNFMADDAVNTYTLNITSGAASGESQTITDYVAATGTITVGVAFGAQIVSGVTFTITAVVPTRTLGERPGSSEFLLSGEASATVSGGTEPLVQTINAGESTVSKMPPGWFGNVMVKL